MKSLGEAARADIKTRVKVWNRARVNTLGMKFVRVEPGTFTMGPNYNAGVGQILFDLDPAHTVRITRPFFMSVTEVTNAQFQQIFPSFRPARRYSPDPDSPAVKVSWHQATQFCELLSKREGATYRLPTEAEWEYSCRAGTDTLFSFGNYVGHLERYAWWNRKIDRAAEVALLRPNAWGLYDMHGNVFEWVSDRYPDELFDSYYRECRWHGVVEDPQGPLTGRTHVVRGGSWHTIHAPKLTSTARRPFPRLAWRLFDSPHYFGQIVGFRVVREAEEENGS